MYVLAGEIGELRYEKEKNISNGEILYTYVPEQLIKRFCVLVRNFCCV